ncbi:MAG: M1 family metallopeptidase [Gemmatimonadota bacterium]
MKRPGSAALGALIALSALTGTAPAQTPVEAAPRPIPYPLTLSPGFASAVEAGSRTMEGRPGPDYWQQSVRYEIEAAVDPTEKHIEGSTRIVYRNASESPPSVLRIRLNQNLHAEGAARHEPAEVTGGFDIERIAVDGSDVAEDATGRPRYEVNGTILLVRLHEAMAAGDTAIVAIDWAFTIPRVGANGRMGWDADNLIYLAYWYPQVAVFDDVIGWEEDPFLGRAEFHADFADYDVRLTGPAGWTVVGTGELQNPDRTLGTHVRERLRRAESSDEVVHVLTAGDFGPGSATMGSEGDLLTWHFTAEKVRDVAYSLTRESLWDAARTPVGDRNGDGDIDYARVDALYRAEATGWPDAAGYAQHAIAFLSEYLDYPYPWSHMTVVEGENIIGGGMEYPMMTLIGAFNGRPAAALYGVIAHELGHMWFPMIVNSDEIRWAWMDEGTTVFNTAQASADYFPGTDPEQIEILQYLGAVAAGFDATMMRWTDWEYPIAWGVAAYPKPAAAMIALREIVGEDTFLEAFRGYIDTWAYKHPKPEDFFHWFEHAAGRDLDWFWRSWYYEQWTLDHAVTSVAIDGPQAVITIEDRGDLPMPARVTIEREDGSMERAEVPVETWLSGTRTAVLRVSASPAITRVRVNADGKFADRDRSNDSRAPDAGG